MEEQSLNGSWQLRQAGRAQWHEARVPGSVYADLIADGTLPDPYWRENEREAFALMRGSFLYRRSFTPAPAVLASARILLRCEGLDTLAHVSLNGQPVGEASNMHITWEWDVKALLLPGENTIEVRFDSPVEYCLREYEKRPAWMSTDAIPGFAYLRKAHCMFGWDWGPRLPDAGIWRSISLIGVDRCRLTGVLVTQAHEAGRVTLTISPEIEGNADSLFTTRVTAPDGRVCEGSDTVVIDEPQLWWPRGYGAQPLYTVSVHLRTADGVLQDVWERRIGLRTLTVSRRPDEWGEEFCHEVNGVRIFAMGGDYIPQDSILARVTPERTRRLLEDAALAHFNTIRVWGGGYYPEDFFYDICDELGLLVWQDLMYACAYYDLTPAFEASIRRETEQNVRRLRSHPSLALLCGNNEMEDFMMRGNRELLSRGASEEYGPIRPSHPADYIKMYEYILPEICRRLAPQTFWWPSSPSSGGSFDAPNAENRGDVHYWDVWHGEKPFTAYRQYHFRYTSEFGFQSFPCLPTVESFTLPEDRNIFSRVMERHQRNKAANGKILAYLSQTFLYPGGFEELLYASQLLQAEAIRYGVEHWRRNRGRCMGAIIWQLNDCWPVASWSSIDYFGRWKALHFAARRFFAPVLLSAEEEGELTQNPQINEFRTDPIACSVRLNVSNETMQPVFGEVCWSLRDPRGAVLREGREAVTVPPLSARWLDRLSFPEADVTASYVSYALHTEQGTLSAGFAIFCAPKHFRFEDPQLTAVAADGEIIVHAQAYARMVWLESDDPDLLPEDNAFDMDPGERRIRILRGRADGLRVRSVYDIGRIDSNDTSDQA